MATAMTQEQPESWRDRLAADTQGSALRELRDFLAGKQAELHRLLDAGSSPDVFALHQKLLAAAEAADNAAVTFWEKHNKE